jgi:hypothetical protein
MSRLAGRRAERYLALASLQLVLGCSAETKPGNDLSVQDLTVTGTIDSRQDAPPIEDLVSVLDRTIREGGGREATPSKCWSGWQPTTCHDCSGNADATGCDQTCKAPSCGDGKSYRAVCSSTTGLCQCFIDNVEVCSCKSKITSNKLGCEPEKYGGQNCCWNVG